MARKDLTPEGFIQGPTITQQGEAARSNLFARFRGQGVKEEEIASRVNTILGGASAAQIGNFATRQFGSLTQPSLTSDLNQAGFASSALPDEEAKLAEQKEARLAKTRAGIETRFGESIEEQKRIGTAEISGTQARLATLRGGGASSSRLAFIKGQVKENAGIIKQFESAREAALLDADTTAADRLDERINTLRDQDFQLRQQEFNEAQALITGQRAERALGLQEKLGLAQLDISTISALVNISEGQTVEIGGQTFTGLKPSAEQEAFFKGSDIISAMKALAPGQTTSLTDPNTGRVFELTGVGSPDVNLKTIQTIDDAGRGTLSIFDPANPETTLKQFDLGIIGKTKTAPISITLGLRAETKTALETATQNINTATNPTTGKVDQDILFAEREKFGIANAGDTKPFDDTFVGKFDPTDPRSAAILPSKAIPEPIDPLDQLINSVIQESFPDLFGI